MSIGQNISVLRKANGMTQKELARLIGKTPQAVSQYECGSNFPSRSTIKAMAGVFGVSSSEITDDDIESASVRVVDLRETEMERIFKQLDDDSKDVVLTVARALARSSHD